MPPPLSPYPSSQATSPVQPPPAVKKTLVPPTLVTSGSLAGDDTPSTYAPEQLAWAAPVSPDEAMSEMRFANCPREDAVLLVEQAARKALLPLAEAHGDHASEVIVDGVLCRRQQVGR